MTMVEMQRFLFLHMDKDKKALRLPKNRIFKLKKNTNMKLAKKIIVKSAQANVQFTCTKCGHVHNLLFSVENGGKVNDKTQCHNCGTDLKVKANV